MLRGAAWKCVNKFVIDHAGWCSWYGVGPIPRIAHVRALALVDK